MARGTTPGSGLGILGWVSSWGIGKGMEQPRSDKSNPDCSFLTRFEYVKLKRFLLSVLANGQENRNRLIDTSMEKL